MRSIAFIFFALALAASAIPVGFGGELRRSGLAGVTPPGPGDIIGENCNSGLVSGIVGGILGGGGGGCGTAIIPTAGDYLPGLGGVGGVPGVVVRGVGGIPGVVGGVPGVPNPAVGSASALPARGVDLTGTAKGLTGQTGKLAGNTNTVGSNPAGGVAGTAGNDLGGAANSLTAGTGKVIRRDSLPDPKKVLASSQQTAGKTMQEVKGHASGAIGVASKAAGPVGARDATGLVEKITDMAKGKSVSGAVGSVAGSAPFSTP